MSTAEMTRPSPAVQAERWRGARTTALRLVQDQHRSIATMRRRRTVVGSVGIVLAVAALVATFAGLGVPPQDDVWATVLWGTLLVGRTAAAAAVVLALVRVTQWTRAPWRLRTALTDALTEAAFGRDEASAERLSARIDDPARWWSPADAQRTEASLAEVIDDLREPGDDRA